MGRILVVDDNSDESSTLCRFLEECGHTVKCVKNGRDALAIILSETPDLVLLDLYMPEMDGPSFLEVVRSYLRLQTLPVVVLTGLGESPAIDHVRSLKVNAILLKGKATLDDIKTAIEQELHRIPV